MPTLTVDIDESFVATRTAREGRVPAFIRRAYANVRVRTFQPSWSDRAITVVRDGEALIVRADGPWRSGDRLVLRTSSDPIGEATLYDGAAVMVQHFAARADPEFSIALVGDGLPPADSIVIGHGAYREQWAAALRRAVELAIECDARLVASLVAFVDFAHESGTNVYIAGPDSRVDGRTLLTELVAAHRAPPQRRRPPALEGIQAQVPELLVESRVGGTPFEPRTQLPRLVNMVDAIHEVYEVDPSVELIQVIAAGQSFRRG